MATAQVTMMLPKFDTTVTVNVPDDTPVGQRYDKAVELARAAVQDIPCTCRQWNISSVQWDK